MISELLEAVFEGSVEAGGVLEGGVIGGMLGFDFSLEGGAVGGFDGGFAEDFVPCFDVISSDAINDRAMVRTSFFPFILQ